MSDSVASRPNGRSPHDGVPPPLDPFAAELQAGETTFRLRADAGQELALGRHSADRSYHPDVDLGDLPNGRTVSRRHARLFREADEWFLRVEPDGTNPTLVGGRRVDPGQSVVLSHGELIQLGAVSVAFHQYDPVQIVGADMIELSITPDEVTVDPGSAVSATITVVNFTDHVDQFLVEIRGLPTEWYRLVLNGLEVEHAEIPLFQTRARAAPASDAVGRLQVHFKPVRIPSARAGAHPFTVRVTSRARPRLRREITGTLTITPFEGLAIQQIPTPATRIVSDFAWVVSNVGNAPTTVTMLAQALGTVGEGAFVNVPNPIQDDNPAEADTRVAYAWQQPQFVLDAGRSHQARMRARVLKRHWWGGVVAYRFNAVAASGTLSVADPASIACPPRVAEWVQAIVRWFLQRATVLLPLIALAVLLWVFLLQRPQILRFDVCEGPVDEALAGRPCDALPSDGSIPEGEQIHFRIATRYATFVNITGSNYKGKSIGLLEQFDVFEDQQGERPTKSTEYILVAQNALGLEANLDQTVLVDPPPRIEVFAASARHIPREGEPITLTWKLVATPNVDAPSIRLLAYPKAPDPAAAPLPLGCAPDPSGQVRILFCGVGSAEVTDRPTTAEPHYVLQAWNEHGVTRQEQIVNVDPPVIDALAANPPAAMAGREVRLQWTARGASRLTLREAANEKDPGGEERDLDLTSVDVPVRPTQDTWYTVTAYNVGGQAIKKVKVSVARPPPPQAIFHAEPESITRGEPAQLTWQIDNAVQMTIQPGLGTVPPGKGSAVVKPDRETEYTLTAITSDGRQLTRTATIQVRPGPVVVDFFTTASPAVEKGETVTLAYSVQNADEISIRDATGAVIKEEKVPTPTARPAPPPSSAAPGGAAPTPKPMPPPALLGSVDITPEKTMVYVLTAKNEGGQITQPVTIEVRPPKTPSPAAGAAAAGAAGAAAAGAAADAAPTAAPPPPTPAGTPRPPLQATAQASRPPTPVPPK